MAWGREAAGSSPPSTWRRRRAGAAPPAAVGARPGLVDVELAALQVATVEAVDRRLGLRALRHLEKSEALRLSRHLVLDDGAGGDLPKLLEGLPQLVLGQSVRE